MPVRKESAAKPRPEQLRQEILAAFEGKIPRVRRSISYQFGILLATAVMVSLPLIYIGVIALTVFAVFYHAVNHVTIMEGIQGRAIIVAILIYIAPLVIGAILVFFMIKPLFTTASDEGRKRSVTRGGEPVLFAFVDQICECIGAPKPKRIDVDCDVNASAGFRSGWFSMMGNDLVLTIGMPMVEGLSMRQFGGVLAHEFGHFSQGAGMRLTYIVRSINHWFERVVYQRDEWDELLVVAGTEIDFRVAWIFMLSQLFVGITRILLWLLMMMGHIVAGFMLRQMEFDADRHEARLAGSDVFESTCRRIVTLNFAQQITMNQMLEFFHQGALIDNLPRLLRSNVDRIPPEIQREIESTISGQNAGWFDTHPPDEQRIANAKRENADGVFRLDRPATDLFLHFDSLAKNVTWDFFRSIFGSRLKPTDLQPVDRLVRAIDQDSSKAMLSYFQGPISLTSPLLLPEGPIAAPAEPAKAVDVLKKSRNQMLSLREKYDDLARQYKKAEAISTEAIQVAALRRAGLQLRSTDFQVPVDSMESLTKFHKSTALKMKQLTEQMQPFQQFARQRILVALELLHFYQLATELDDIEAMRAECERLVPVLYAVHSGRKAWLKFRNEHYALEALLKNFEVNKQYEPLVRETLAAAKRQCAAIHAVCDQWQFPYPFEDSRGEISVGEYLVESIPAANEFKDCFDTGNELIDRLDLFYANLLGRLAMLAEEVESAYHLAPLPDPNSE